MLVKGVQTTVVVETSWFTSLGEKKVKEMCKSCPQSCGLV